MRALMLFVIVAGAFFISGCSDVFNYGHGVVINKFEFDPSYIEAGQPTYLSLEFQNQGQFAAEDVYLNVYGLRDEWVPLDGETLSDWVLVGDVEAPVIEGNNLIAQGEIVYYDWMFKAPKDVKSEDRRVNTMWTRVCYSYKTIARSKIKMVSSDEWYSRTQQEKIDVTVSKGPVDLKIESMQPIIVHSSEPGFTLLRVSIDNAGGGVFLNDSSVCEDLGSEGIEDLLNQIGYVKVSLDGNDAVCDFDSEIYLRRGESQVFTVNCDNLDIGNGPIREIDVEIEFRYKYYIDSNADVAVKGVNR
ncbi:MAG: hypothetical protein KAJ54_03255 [Candidatus Aenigmarchaeota archaeon]|nr:hypothetical protein [Candidatus Aenigmarchaeota archaeon]